MNLNTVAYKPEECTCTKMLAMLTRNATISVLGPFSCTTNPSAEDLGLNIPSERRSNYDQVSCARPGLKQDQD